MEIPGTLKTSLGGHDANTVLIQEKRVAFLLHMYLQAKVSGITAWPLPNLLQGSQKEIWT